MNRGVYWWVCLAALAASAAGAVVGAIRWLGPGTLALALAPVGHAPLFVGTVGPTGIYALMQSLPEARAPLSIRGVARDGWSVALLLAALCATLASFPITPGGENESLFTTPFVLVAAFLCIDRMRRVQRQLAASGFVRPS